MTKGVLGGFLYVSFYFTREGKIGQSFLPEVLVSVPEVSPDIC